MPLDAASTHHDTPKFDVAALLAANSDNALDLIDRHVNPAFAAVLRTIGFDARFQRGQGAYLFDDKGHRYIDCLGGYAVFASGRNHPVIRNALKQAMDLDLPNLPGVGTFRVAGLLARELAALAPKDPKNGEPLDTCFFANGGAEAIDAALKHARAATGRDRIVYCQRSYHGLTLGALSVTGNPEFRDGFGPLGPTTEVAFNDADALAYELKKGDVAAFICEPIQGKGVNLPSENYLRRASELCREHGAVFILDEIQTGLGRTGRMFAGEHFGMGKPGAQGWCPDILVLAKALSGGFIPVSAVLTKRWIHQAVFSNMNNCSRIQTTFGMNDLGMVAGLASLHVIKHEKIVENTAEVGDYLIAGLRRTLGKYDMVKEVRGLGLMIAIEFQRPKAFLLAQAWDMLHKVDPSLFCQAIILPLMSDHRIIAQVAGHRLDVIKLIPALVLSKADADEVIKAMEICVANCQKLPGPIYEIGKKLGSAAVRRMGSIVSNGAQHPEPVATS
jgi:acetylornithine/succinyldiaminopimelate/putrescine aminotransferase